MEKHAKKIFIFGSSYHSNLGDHAQTYAIKKWCKENYPEFYIFELNSAPEEKTDFYPLMFALREKMSPDDKILIQSGYRTTDVYRNELIIALAAVNVFQDRPIVFFPQTVFFEDESAADPIAKIFNSHRHLLIMTRDAHSHELAKKYFKTPTLLCPDIVNSLIGKNIFGSGHERSGIMLCKRENDKEAFFLREDCEKLMAELGELDSRVDMIDTSLPYDNSEIQANRGRFLYGMINTLSRYRLVITDRLHGVIFALTANTPVIVLKTKMPKVRESIRFYEECEAFRDYVHYCETLEDAKTTAEYVYGLRLRYDLPPYFAEKYYDGLKDVIDGILPEFNAEKEV